MKTSEKKEHDSDSFWSKHKNKILLAFGILGAATLAVLGIKCYIDNTSANRWFKNATLEELKDVRDKIHKEALNYTVNDEHRESLWSLLPIFDKRISDLEWAGETPRGPAYHREHGYNLYKPD